MPITDPIFSTTALQYASDANYDVEGDSYDSSPEAIEPSLGEIKQGLFRPDQQIPSQQVNWQLGQFAQLLSALIANDGLHEAELATHASELADHETRIEFIETHSPRIKVVPFLTSGTTTVPVRCTSGFSYGSGGGGAGGNGLNGTNVVDRWMGGAAGGGGALASMQILPTLTPGDTINVDVGAGGFDPIPTLGNSGPDGGDTIVRVGSTVLATHVGAQGGHGALGAQSTANWAHYTLGGAPVKGSTGMLIGPAAQGIRVNTGSGTLFGSPADPAGTMSLVLVLPPSSGGFGGGTAANPLAGVGSMNPVGGFSGGAAGIKGHDGDCATDVFSGVNTTRRGGGGGGGGGAGPFGPGGAGGNGQNGHPTAADGTRRTGGFNAPASSGAGGGGGGSCAWEIDVEIPGLNNNNFGGAGGSGRAYLIFVLEST